MKIKEPNGFDNEKEIADYINENSGKYNNNIESFLNYIFNTEIDNNLKIEAKVLGPGIKPDLSITYNGKTKHISVKKGSGNSVHQEKIEIFTTFMREMKATKKITDDLLYFHYGDGTHDNTGKIRKSASTVIKEKPSKIISINNFFNTEEFVETAVKRFLISGNIENSPEVDFIYHGTIEFGFWVGKKETIDYFINKADKTKTNMVNISNLNYQIWNRNINFNPKTAKRRYVMQVKWSTMVRDMGEIINGRNN